MLDEKSQGGGRGLLRWALPRRPSRFIWPLLPSFVARALGYVDKDAVIPRPNSTSWLTGLRGVASLVVAGMHNSDDYWWNEMQRAYFDGEDRHLIQLPVVRSFAAGSFMVAIFFVISGFVLSHGPLRCVHEGRPASEAIATLPSSVFRRGFRLFLPVVPVLLLSGVPIYMGVYYNIFDSKPVRPEPTLAGHLALMWKAWVMILSEDNGHIVVPQAWTLGIEFRGSLVVFLLCLALVRCPYRVRLWSVACLAVWMLYIGVWPMFLFMAGMALSDMRLARDRRAAAAAAAAVGLPTAEQQQQQQQALLLPPRPSSLTAKEPHQSKFKTAVWAGLLVVGIGFGGWPVLGDPNSVWPYRWMKHVPTWRNQVLRFWDSLGAVLVVTSIDRLPWARRLLDSRPVQYLGEVSFGVYLCHNIIAKTVGKALVLNLTDRWENKLAAWAVVFFGLSIPLAIWAGDVHWRIVDKKCVRFSRWLAENFGVC